MKIFRRHKFAPLAGIGIVFLITACDFDGYFNNMSFDYSMHGKWESADPGEYKGTVVITYNTITITGYSESQGGRYNRPFRGFHKGIAFSGYSEEGKIFIISAGVVRKGIPYKYENIEQQKHLTLIFGDREEVLKKNN